MKHFYVPQKLILAKEKIMALHKSTGKLGAGREIEDEKFLTFLNKITKRDRASALKYAKRAEPEMISRLSAYISRNEKKLKYDNLFYVLEQLATIDDWKIIYEDWQDYFENQEVRAFLSRSHKDIKNFSSHLEKTIPQASLDWLASDNFLLQLVKACVTAEDSETFVSQLAAKGVLEGKKISRECQRLFLLYCPRGAYLDFSDQMVDSSYPSFIEGEKLSFLINFFSKLSLEDLDKFENTFKAIKNTFMHVLESKLAQNLDVQWLLDKFEQWAERMKLKTAFAGDIYRFNFWKQYQKGNKVVDFSDAILYIDFGNYIALEFKQQASGACYIIEKQAFENEIEAQMYRLSLAALKSYLNEKYKARCVGVVGRVEHTMGQTYWYDKFRAALNLYRIRPSAD